jgi:hypothetical protein
VIEHSPYSAFGPKGTIPFPLAVQATTGLAVKTASSLLRTSQAVAVTTPTVTLVWDRNDREGQKGPSPP